MMRILNIGCGDEAYGTDFVDIKPIREGVIACDINHDKLPFEDRGFDEVYSKFVLEHITNLDNYFKEAHRVLKLGGKLTVITDNAFGIRWWLPISKYYMHVAEEPWIHAPHICLFNEHHLLNLAKMYGFRSAKVSYKFCEEPPMPLWRKAAKRIYQAMIPPHIANKNIMLTAFKEV